MEHSRPHLYLKLNHQYSWALHLESEFFNDENPNPPRLNASTPPRWPLLALSRSAACPDAEAHHRTVLHGQRLFPHRISSSEMGLRHDSRVKCSYLQSIFEQQLVKKIPSMRFGHYGLPVFCHQSNDCIVVGGMRFRTEEGQFSFSTV